MPTSDKGFMAFELFDLANLKDSNKEQFMGREYPKEVLYSIRMTKKLNEFAPDASGALHLKARAQHICRWEIPGESYETNLTGYLKWRQDLKKFHAEKASEILEKVGYDLETMGKVKFLLEKKAIETKQRNPNRGRCHLPGLFGILL